MRLHDAILKVEIYLSAPYSAVCSLCRSFYLSFSVSLVFSPSFFCFLYCVLCVLCVCMFCIMPILCINRHWQVYYGWPWLWLTCGFLAARCAFLNKGIPLLFFCFSAMMTYKYEWMNGKWVSWSYTEIITMRILS